MTEGSQHSTRRLRVGRASAVTFIVALCLLALDSRPARAQSTFSLSYSARLTDTSGAPLTGPVAVKATFWDANTGGQQLGPTLSFDAVQLNNGALSLDLALTGSQVGDVFSDGSRAVYIEIMAGDKTYPRQMYTFVPLALRIPFDEKNLKFNDSGKLTLAVGTKPNTNSFLTQDSSGALTWGSPASTQLAISDQDVATGAAISQSKIAGLSASLAAKENSITAGTTAQYFRGDKTWQALTTASVTEGGTNLYYSDARARSALAASGPITYGLVSGTIGINQASATTDGYLSSTDWTTFNAKQNALGYAPLNKAGDTMSGVLDMNSSDIRNAGSIGMAASKTLLLSNNATDPAGLTAADKGKTWFNSATNEVKYWDGTIVKALGVAGSGLANLNGVTTTTQSFATPGTSGTAPTWSSGGSTHTLNIPLASGPGVTAGLVSNTDYTSFGNKVGAVTGTTGIAVTNASGTATVTLANTTVTAGTYSRANITVDAQGRLTAAQSAPAIVDADIANSAAISQSKISGLSTSLAAKEDAVTAGTNSQYYRGDKTWQSLTSTAVTEGTNLYYTDARARAALTPTAPITYSVTTGTVGINQASNSSDGYLSSTDWNTFTNKISSVTAGTGLIGGGSSGAVTLNADVGTTANKLVKLDANAKLPAVDGSALTNITPSNLSGTVPVANGGTGASSTSANYVFAGPNGSAGAPAFRALVATDYPAMVGANGTTVGTRGAVPAPAATDNGKFLRGDGTWQTPPALAAGATNQIQYNSGGSLAGDANFVYAGGNVGIGSATPGYPLTVAGNASFTGNYIYNGSGATQSFWFADSTNAVIGLPSTTGALYVKDSAGSAKAAIAANGNSYFVGGSVGIGLANPVSPLHIWKATDDMSLFEIARFSAYGSGETATRILGGSSNANPSLRQSVFDSYRGDTNLVPILFTQTNNAGSNERVRIASSGNVGISTTSPAALLEVNGTEMSRSSVVKSADGNTCYQVVVDNSGSLNSVKVNCSTLAKLELYKVSGAWQMPDGTYLASCSAYLASASYTGQGDGLYWIDPDGAGANPAFKAWCDMNTDGGGWTLIMRFKNDGTLNYTSSYWTDTVLLDEDTTASQKPWLNANGKFTAWNYTTGTTLRGCKGGGGSNNCITQTWTGAVTANTLFNAAYKAGSTARWQWVWFFDGLDDTAEPYCNTGGINYNPNIYAQARLGFTGNNENDCATSDTAWGFGIKYPNPTSVCGMGVILYLQSRSLCYQGSLWIK